MKMALIAVFGLMTLSMAPSVMGDDIPDLTGTRRGNWSVSAYGGAVTLTVVQSGSKVKGELDLKGARNFSYGAISGNVSKQGEQYVLSFTSGRLKADLNVTDTQISGPFCLEQCGTMTFTR